MGQCPRQGRTCLFSAPPGTLPPLPLLDQLKPSCLLQVSINHTLTHSDQQSLEIDNYLDSSILDSSFPTFPGLRAEVSCFVPASRAGLCGLSCTPTAASTAVSVRTKALVPPDSTGGGESHSLLSLHSCCSGRAAVSHP